MKKPDYKGCRHNLGLIPRGIIPCPECGMEMDYEYTDYSPDKSDAIETHFCKKCGVHHVYEGDAQDLLTEILKKLGKE